ncbi:hypothetical protein BU24DRAFT_80854 [Aaosphaeria arxii CBS 175.79]|uniref:Uncharacterized protein n=1 Tax=Aaosphaeria arxii CBS 175.79 TaxID=1450172 RepID=A0A6A5X9R8_9PLEO|nr:uncharacterized protein BU24DRAFT_80854 [Aaosphaeria arxii CBS 175.79]KAF2009683.1 hypothetical protein BU24DRAFT_80854 [Aaosphaeria arxii CBS 175.79]
MGNWNETTCFYQSVKNIFELGHTSKSYRKRKTTQQRLWHSMERENLEHVPLTTTPVLCLHYLFPMHVERWRQKRGFHCGLFVFFFHFVSFLPGKISGSLEKAFMYDRNSRRIGMLFDVQLTSINSDNLLAKRSCDPGQNPPLHELRYSRELTFKISKRSNARFL